MSLLGERDAHGPRRPCWPVVETFLVLCGWSQSSSRNKRLFVYLSVYLSVFKDYSTAAPLFTLPKGFFPQDGGDAGTLHSVFTTTETERLVGC